MKKIALLLVELPDSLQLRLTKILSEHFPHANFEIFFDKSRVQASSAVAFALWTGRTDTLAALKSFPLFIFLDPSVQEEFPALEFAEQCPAFDCSSVNDPDSILKGRLLVFLKRAMDFFEKESSSQKESEQSAFGNIVALIKHFLSILFRPRAVSQALECSPIIGDKWVRIRRLGFGSFGEVWLVQRKGTISEHFAVAKIPHDEKANPKFLQEAEILKKLQDHSNAVKVVEVIEQSGKTIIIEEFIEGKTLQQLMDEGMTSSEKEKVFLQILDMVAYAHDHQIMHRDLKPENVIVTSRGVAKVLDFGTAKDVSRRSISSTVIGSRPYMAPEQIQGESRIASDVWALGVILYALATDYVPFYSENEKELMDMILESPPEPPSVHAPTLPPKLESLILKCLEKNWKNRFHNARELQKSLLTDFPDFGKGSYIPGS